MNVLSLTQRSHFRRFRCRCEITSAFTATDLLTIVAVMAVLLLVHRPVLANATRNSKAASCANNVRQLADAWLMFASENDGMLPLNRDTSGSWTNWVAGFIDFSGHPDNTNILKLTNSSHASLGPYSKDPMLYRCPEDRSSVRVGNRVFSRVRSYSMNSALGGGGGWLPSPPYRLFSKLSDIIRPTPANCWLLMDEHPDSINDAVLSVNMVEENRLGQSRIIDYPGSFHEGGAAVSFADGHVELHHWIDARTKPSPKYNGIMPLNVQTPNNLDMLWLSERTSSRINP